MRILIQILIAMSILLIVGFTFDVFTKESDDILVNDEGLQPKIDVSIDSSSDVAPKLQQPTSGLTSLLGKSSTELINTLGKPVRKDPSLYDYEWWIYPINHEEYVQVAVHHNKIVSF